MDNNKSMINGNIAATLIIFAIPILIGNIFQQLYNVADTAVIGNFLGDKALAAVGEASPVYNLIIGFANGLTNGFSVVIARYYGANDKERLSKAVAYTYILTGIFSILLTIISLIGIKPLLVLLSTPKSIIDDTTSYLVIILGTCMITMIYNMFAGLLRALGNSRTPLYFLIVSSIVNVVLDIFFVSNLKLGIKGAAYATVIAQIVSVIMCIIYVVKKCPLLTFNKKFAGFDKVLVNDLFLTGLSMGLMLGVVSIGSVALQGAVNTLGTDIITAHTAARKIDDIFMLPLGTFAISASTFASQNFGAGKMNRVKKGIGTALFISVCWSIFSTLAVIVAGKFMITAISGSSNYIVISNALKYMRINTPLFIILSVLLTFRSSLQGLGRKIVPLSASIIELVSKFVAAAFIVPIMGYNGICILEPIIWIICAIPVSIDFFALIKRNKLFENQQAVTNSF